ncbi:hypothetical protein SAMN05660865_01629 [Caloramator fervidus]|uniref:Uncharacterized protein n=1 Tax=Caloramator fervidus TaxID=29344 RepID=A0A1H5X1A9_9CLOT|nr:hypothetical protein [Caloramator fervidus]SEG05150.1 hypothetical protein SAMN05660865_01629 [Caloramator fervidus]
MNVVELYFTIADYDVLVKIANKWKINVKGFANVSRAPEILLRKSLILKFNSKHDMFKKMLEEIYGFKLKELDIKDVDDFLYTFLSYPLKEKVPFHIPLGMLILLFPDFVEDNLEAIYDNFINKRHIFEGLVKKIELTKENCYEAMEKLLQLKDPIDYFSILESEAQAMMKFINQEKNFSDLRKKFKGMEFFEFANYFIENREHIPDYISVLAYVSENIKSIQSMPIERRNFFNKLVSDAIVCFNIDLYREIQNKLKEFQEKSNLLEKEIRNKEEKIHVIEKEIENLQKSYINYKEKVEKELEEIKHNLEEKVKQEEKDISLLNDNTIITNFSYDRIFDSIGNCNVISPSNLEVLDNFDDYKGVIFIHRNSIDSTKDLLEIEKFLRNKNLEYHVIFGMNVEELVRNIIIKKKNLEG